MIDLNWSIQEPWFDEKILDIEISKIEIARQGGRETAAAGGRKQQGVREMIPAEQGSSGEIQRELPAEEGSSRERVCASGTTRAQRRECEREQEYLSTEGPLLKNKSSPREIWQVQKCY